MKKFSLVEILVVIAIISILASFLIPVLSQARERSRETLCINNQRQISIASSLHLDDNDNKFPAQGGYWAKRFYTSGTKKTGDGSSATYQPLYNIQGYLNSMEVFICPTNDRGTTLDINYENDYGMNYFIREDNVSITSLPNPSSTIHTADTINYQFSRSRRMQVRHDNNNDFHISWVDGHITQTYWLSVKDSYNILAPFATSNNFWGDFSFK